MNGTACDVARRHHGVVAGRHEVLRRQGLPAGVRCSDPDQAEPVAAAAGRCTHPADDASVRGNPQRRLA